MEKSIRFWDRWAEKYAKRPIADPKTYQQKLEQTQRYFTASSSVLEFGCGTGSTALIHAEHVKRIVAIDTSQKMIDIAQRKAHDIGVKNAEFLKSTLFELPYPPESFDVVLGLNVLHLMDDMDAAIQKSYELLVPGGVFVTSTACLKSSSWVLKFILPMASKFGWVPSVRFFDMETLEKSVTRVGFKVLEKTTPHKDKRLCFMIARK